MAIIRVNQLAVPAVVGVHDRERAAPQPLFVDLELTVSETAAATDRLEDAVDYEALSNRLREVAAGSAFLLIERLAARLLEEVMRMDGIRHATLTLSKPQALPYAANVQVQLTATRNL